MGCVFSGFEFGRLVDLDDGFVWHGWLCFGLGLGFGWFNGLCFRCSLCLCAGLCCGLCWWFVFRCLYLC